MKNPNEPCEQKCGHLAECYAMDPYPNGWGGHYCYECVPTGFHIVDRYDDDNKENN